MKIRSNALTKATRKAACLIANATFIINFLALSTCFLAGEANAANWQRIGNDKKSKYAIDADSTERINGATGTTGTLRAWHRENYTPRRLHEAWAFSYSSVKQYTEFQCGKRMAAVLQRIYYTESGTELKSEAFDAKDATFVIPDSPTEAAYNYVCRAQASKPAASTETLTASASPGANTAKTYNADKDNIATKLNGTTAPAAWGYTGKYGPKNWSKLSTEFSLCGIGERQSPIDIKGTIKGDLTPLQINYQAIAIQLIDDGRGIEALAQGGGSLNADGEDFELQAIRFRHPGEEVVVGKRAAMSLQFEHRAKSGRIAILTVPVQAGKAVHPEAYAAIRKLWTELPLERGRPGNLSNATFNPADLLPAKRDYITYSGSLTEPPCTEGILWLIMKQPLKISSELINDFGKVYKHNVRPVQPTNDRVIKESR